jgi:hypothetical protein
MEAESATVTPAPPDAPPPAAPSARVYATKSDLFPERRGKPELFDVWLPEKQLYAKHAKLLPIEMAWITQRCTRRVPDPDHDGLDMEVWDPTRRGFLMVAIAMRYEDGKRMFDGSVEDSDVWDFGATKVSKEFGNADYSLLNLSVQQKSGLTMRMSEAVKKD